MDDSTNIREELRAMLQEAHALIEARVVQA